MPSPSHPKLKISDLSIPNWKDIPDNSRVCWAQMSTSPFWPARICGEVESLAYIEHRPKNKGRYKNKKTNSKTKNNLNNDDMNGLYAVETLDDEDKDKIELKKAFDEGYRCVYFFGSKCYGWCYESNIRPFLNPDMISLIKKNKSKVFHHGIREGALLCYTYYGGINEEELINADIIDDDISDKIPNLTFLEKAKIAKLPKDLLRCLYCGGTENSGPLISCVRCNKIHHSHCIDNPIPPGGTWPNGVGWFCNDCKPYEILVVQALREEEKKKNLELEKNDLINNKNTTTTSNNKRKRKGSKSNNNTKEEDEPINKKTKLDDIDNDILSTDSINNIEKIDEETCFVCNQGGEVIICDFPGCNQVYHKVCIWNKFVGGGYDDDDEKLWFCPRHECVICKKNEKLSIEESTELIQQGNVSMRAIMAVSEVENSNTNENNNNNNNNENNKNENNMNENNKIEKFFHCSTCPASFCELHQDEYLTTNIKIDETKCLYCNSEHPLVKLGKILEKSWVDISSNYLSLPFFHPFLPGISLDNIPIKINENNNDIRKSRRKIKKKKFDLYEDDNTNIEIYDLYSILKKIQSFQYSTTATFILDLTNLLNKLDIVQIPPSFREAFSSLISQAMNNLKLQNQNIMKIEGECQLLNSTNDNNNNNNSNNNNNNVEILLNNNFNLNETYPNYGYNWRIECQGIDKSLLNKTKVNEKSLMEWNHYLLQGTVVDKLYFNNPDLTNYQDGPLQEFYSLPYDNDADIQTAVNALMSIPYHDKIVPNRLIPLSTLDDLLEEQSKTLKRALILHARIQDQWELSQEELLKIPYIKNNDNNNNNNNNNNNVEEEILNLGESGILTEVLVANKNLKLRLEAKENQLKELLNKYNELK